MRLPRRRSFAAARVRRSGRVPRPTPSSVRRDAPRRPSVQRRRLGGLVAAPLAEVPKLGRAVLTGRAAILAVTVCAVVLSLAYPLREFAAQRGEIANLRAQRVAAEDRVAALERQYRRWQDPAYVRTKARERLHYVMPGERAYVVVAPRVDGGPRAPAAAGAGVPAPWSDRPWYDRVWASVTRAGQGSPR